MSTDKKQLKTSKNYAEALFAIGEKMNSCEKFYNELSSVIEILYVSKDLNEFLNNPLISHSDKKDVIYKVFGKDFDLQIVNLLNVLVDNNRTQLIKTICECYEKIYDKKNSVSKIEIISAIELSQDNKTRLVEVLSGRLGQKIVPEYKINEEIIGGLIIKIQDTFIDLSLENRIKTMKKQLI